MQKPKKLACTTSFPVEKIESNIFKASKSGSDIHSIVYSIVQVQRKFMAKCKAIKKSLNFSLNKYLMTQYSLP